MTVKETIIENERILLEAFQQKDLRAIEELIHTDALFVLPNGMSVTKNMVIENYRSGRTALSEITASNQEINLMDDTAVVAFTLHLKGNSLGHVLDTKFRYIRVWKKFITSWKVIAVSGVPILTTV